MCVCWRFLRVFLAVLLLGLLPGAAAGGAWTRAAGDGQLIFTSGRQIAPVGALTGNAASSDKTQAQIFVEYGVLDSLTVGGSLYGEVSSIDANDGAALFSAFARQRLYRDDAGNVASAQIGFALPAEKLISGRFARSRPNSTPELRLAGLYGTSWWGDWGSAYLTTEAGWAWRSEGTGDELRGELAIGYRPWRCCTAGLSLYATAPLSGTNDAALKLVPSVAYTLYPPVGRNEKKPQDFAATTTQIGLVYDLLNPDDGIGFLLSLWRPF